MAWIGRDWKMPLFCLLCLVVLGTSTAANDRCVDAVPLLVPAMTLGSTVGSTQDPEVWTEVCPKTPWLWSVPDSPGVWYSVTGTGNRMTASTCHPGTTTLDTSLRVFCGDCDHLVCVGGNEDAMLGRYPVDAACDPFGNGYNYSSTVTWCSRAGQRYFIYVNGWVDKDPGRDPGTGDFELSVTDTGNPCWGALECTPVDVVGAFLADNADGDGWADTGETVAMRLEVYNRSGVDLTGLEATISTDDPRIACVADSLMPLGNLPAGESLTTSGAFLFRVAEVDRASLTEDFSALFRLSLASNQFADIASPRCSVGGESCSIDEDCPNDDLCENMVCEFSGTPCTYGWDCAEGEGYCVGTCSLSGNICRDYREVPGEGRIHGCNGPDVCVDESQEWRIDLDLDAVGGVGPTTFFEGFESGTLGNLTEMNLDAGLGEPVASDGYRCQYHDPEDPNSKAYERDLCWVGIDPAHADAYYWQVDDARSVTGSHSAYMGIDLGGGEHSTPLGVLEAIGTSQPINLGWERVCSASGAVCSEDLQCPAGELCLAASPELSFKHQLDLLDWRTIHFPGAYAHPGHAVDRAVVQVRSVDESGAPLGPWTTVEPYKTRYNAEAENAFFNCTFDPIDDGNTEDDLFQPGDRYLLGPSSTCFPEPVFSCAGETEAPFDPGNLKGSDDGPGLQGASGLGTWVESKVDLNAYRGQRIQLRFLLSTTEYAYYQGWYQLFGPAWPDEGWWIDDVMVTHALVEPAVLAVDAKDNSGLGVDADADCVADSVDCAPGVAGVWAVPGEVQQLRLTHSGGVGGTTTLSWTRPQALGGTEAEYVVVASGPGFCEEVPIGPGTTAPDGDDPAPGTVHRFLVRADNACGSGPLGTDSQFNPRTGCP